MCVIILEKKKEEKRKIISANNTFELANNVLIFPLLALLIISNSIIFAHNGVFTFVWL